jgi:D-alanyl-D-alanine carboxypeptidase (penicillin-binding protein 5/6)
VTSTVVTEPVEEAREGSEVGRVDFLVGDRTVTVPLTLDETIEAPDLWWRLANPPWAR